MRTIIRERHHEQIGIKKNSARARPGGFPVAQLPEPRRNKSRAGLRLNESGLSRPAPRVFRSPRASRSSTNRPIYENYRPSPIVSTLAAHCPRRRARITHIFCLLFSYVILVASILTDPTRTASLVPRRCIGSRADLRGARWRGIPLLK